MGHVGHDPKRLGITGLRAIKATNHETFFFFKGPYISSEKNAETLEGKVFFWFVSLFLFCLLFSAPFYLSGFGAGRGRQNPLWAPSTGVESLRRRREKKDVGSAGGVSLKKKTKKNKRITKKTMTATVSAELSVIHGGTVPES